MKKTKPVEFKPPTTEDQIAAIQRKLLENPPAREYAALSRTLAQLTGAITRSRQTQWKDRKAQEEQDLEHPRDHYSGLSKMTPEQRRSWLETFMDESTGPNAIPPSVMLTYYREEVEAIRRERAEAKAQSQSEEVKQS